MAVERGLAATQRIQVIRSPAWEQPWRAEAGGCELCDPCCGGCEGRRVTLAALEGLLSMPLSTAVTW